MNTAPAVEPLAAARFVVDTLVLPPGAQQDALGRRVQASTRHWRLPALAYLAGTWLGATGLQPNTWINRGAERAVSAAAARYDAQADAVLYLGPGEVLTASRVGSQLVRLTLHTAQAVGFLIGRGRARSGRRGSLGPWLRSARRLVFGGR